MLKLVKRRHGLDTSVDKTDEKILLNNIFSLNIFAVEHGRQSMTLN